jgi:uncharacterized protein (DUF58 family)
MTSLPPPPTRVLDPEVVTRIANLRLKAQRAVEGLRSGIHRSPHRGASVIFAEHREYRPGDDLRLLDWRAFARSDRFTVKRFEQETHLRAHLLLDVSASMRFDGGVPELDKRQHAATLLAALAFVLLGQGDAAGAITFSRGVHGVVPARARPGQLDAILDLLVATPSGDEPTDLEAGLTACMEHTGRRGLIAVASDLLDLREPALDPLTHMRALGHEVIVLHVLHPDEIDFPFGERLRFADPESDQTLDTDPDAVREGYQRELQAFLIGARRRCAAAGAHYVLARTDAKVHETVADAVRGRARAAWV